MKKFNLMPTGHEGINGNQLYIVVELNEDYTDLKVIADKLSLTKANKMVKELRAAAK
jgi:hypothetical protein